MGTETTSAPSADNSAKAQQYLTTEQVHDLNKKHGWFQFGDAQGDVSRAFAHDAIALHERMRAAAPQMLAALQEAFVALDSTGTHPGTEAFDREVQAMLKVRAAILDATGAAQ